MCSRSHSGITRHEIMCLVYVYSLLSAWLPLNPKRPLLRSLTNVRNVHIFRRGGGYRSDEVYVQNSRQWRSYRQFFFPRRTIKLAPLPGLYVGLYFGVLSISSFWRSHLWAHGCTRPSLTLSTPLGQIESIHVYALFWTLTEKLPVSREVMYK